MDENCQPTIKNKTILAYKKEGESWKGAMDGAREKLGIPESSKLSILGRLDEMAEGLLLIGVDVSEEEKKELIGFKKEYEWSILLGATTDTYDILGLVESVWDLGELPHDFENICVNVTGKFDLPYPSFSSKEVDGMAMWEHARMGNDVEAPQREMEIISHEFLGSEKISSKDLLLEIIKRVSKVEGNFRQKEIIEAWQKALAHDGVLIEAKFRTKVSSGTYIRAIAHSWGQKLGCGGIAWCIKRTKIGEFKTEA